jgi:hypothetical protein
VAYADMVNYSLDNVILNDGTQMHGTFTWTFNTGDFENGVGQFIFYSQDAGMFWPNRDRIVDLFMP